MSELTLTSIIGRHLADGITVDEVLSRVMGDPDLMLAVESQAALEPLIRARIHAALRQETRQIEDSVERRLRDLPDHEVPSRADVRRDLQNSGFALPSGRFVFWLDATADDHRERAGWFRDQSSRMVEKATAHERAAAEIEAHGVVCLRDLESLGAAS